MFVPIAADCTSADARAHALRCAATIFFLLRSLDRSRWFTGTGTAGKCKAVALPRSKATNNEDDGQVAWICPMVCLRGSVFSSAPRLAFQHFFALEGQPTLGPTIFGGLVPQRMPGPRPCLQRSFDPSPGSKTVVRNQCRARPENQGINK